MPKVEYFSIFDVKPIEVIDNLLIAESEDIFSSIVGKNGFYFDPIPEPGVGAATLRYIQFTPRIWNGSIAWLVADWKSGGTTILLWDGPLNDSPIVMHDRFRNTKTIYALPIGEVFSELAKNIKGFLLEKGSIDFEFYLSRLYRNKNLLQEREAKYGGNIPLDLINEREDYEKAIALTEGLVKGKLSKPEFYQELDKLNVVKPNQR